MGKTAVALKAVSEYGTVSKNNTQNYLKGLLKYSSHVYVTWNFLYSLPLKHIIYRLNSEVGMRIQISICQSVRHLKRFVNIEKNTYCFH